MLNQTFIFQALQNHLRLLRPVDFRFGGTRCDELFFQVCKENKFCSKKIKQKRKRLRVGLELSKDDFRLLYDNAQGRVLNFDKPLYLIKIATVG